MRITEYTPNRAEELYRMNRPAFEGPVKLKMMWFDTITNENMDGRICLDVHTHSFYEMFLMFAGTAYYEHGNDTIELEAGYALFLPPNTPHRYIKSTGHFLKATLAFSFSESFPPPITLDGAPIKFKIPDDVAPNVNFILKHSESKDIFVPNIVSGRVLEIIYSVCKAIGTPILQTDYREIDPRVMVAKRFIDNNLSRVLTTEDVAKECCLCAKQLGRIFKNSTGITVFEYITRSRVKNAQILLLQDRYNIKEIGYMLGFENESSFVSFFKRHCGVTPGVFKRENND